MRRTNGLLGVLALVIAGVVLANALGVLPAGALDLIMRAAPALLVILGLGLLLRGRVPLAGGVALIIGVALTAGVAAYAFNTRAAEQRTDTQQSITQAISTETTLLRVQINALSTDIEVLGGLARAAGVTGMFIGSSDHRVDVNFSEAADDSATLVLTETRQSGDFPLLEALGRGTMQIEVPPGIALDLQFTGESGAIILNLDGTALERLNVSVQRGDLIITLPDYNPSLGEEGALRGTLNVAQGDLTMLIPAGVSARIDIPATNTNDIQYNANTYNLLASGALEARDYVVADNTVLYQALVPNGQVRVESP